MDEVVKNMEKSIIVSLQTLAKQYRLYSFCSIAISACSRLCPLTAVDEMRTYIRRAGVVRTQYKGQLLLNYVT